MADLFAEGYGDALALDRDRVGITWAQFHTHLYSRFYVYQYATGISGAHALARPILDGDADAAARYVEFLKAGGSLDPLDALKTRRGRPDAARAGRGDVCGVGRVGGAARGARNLSRTGVS
jgi:oligoendopeptidase F